MTKDELENLEKLTNEAKSLYDQFMINDDKVQKMLLDKETKDLYENNKKLTKNHYEFLLNELNKQTVNKV
jgi:hypothetical protein